MKKLRLKKDSKEILPIFYLKATYRKMKANNYDFKLPYSKKYKSYANIEAPKMLITKIIDYSKLD